MLASLAAPLLPLVRRHTRPPASAIAIAAAQSATLAKLVRRLARCTIGQRFGLDRLPRGQDLLERFRENVALTQYGDYADLIERVASGASEVMFPGQALALAQTSGTTRDAQHGERFVPQNRELLAHHRLGGLTALTRLLAATGTQILDGRLLMLGGSTAFDRRRAVPAGDLSGIITAHLPRWIAHRYEPGPAIAAAPGWEERLALMAERLPACDLRLASGIPSWLLVLWREVCRRRGVVRADAVWPRMRALIHGGHAIEPFVPALAEHLPPDTTMLEVYPASEAFIAIGERPWKLGEGIPPALEVLSDHGVFCEFLPDGDSSGAACVTADQLESGGLYRVLVTTPGGLVRYQIGDLVRGVGPGRMRFAGRVRTRLSMFGEHVEGCALATALHDACRDSHASVAHYHVAPRLDVEHARGRHEWWVEFVRPPVDASTFIAAIDASLSRQVLDYAAHRAGDLQLLAPTLYAVPTGTFHAALAERGHLGDQHKVPQAWNDHTWADALARHVHHSTTRHSEPAL